MANSLGVVIARDQGAVPVTSLSQGAITNPTSVLTRPAGGCLGFRDSAQRHAMRLYRASNPLYRTHAKSRTLIRVFGGDGARRSLRNNRAYRTGNIEGNDGRCRYYL